MTPDTLLIDARNWHEQLPVLRGWMSSSPQLGIDCETEDSERHDGLKTLMRVNDEGFKSKATRLIFDMRRLNLCGVSLYGEAFEKCVYINTGHLDAENRVALPLVADLLRGGKNYVAHNAPFELTVMREKLGINLPDITCTLQMAVSAFGPHEFSHARWIAAGQGGIATLMPSIFQELGRGGIVDHDKLKFSAPMEELLYKIISKVSDADHSYNGLVDSIAYGYGLKRLIKNFFGYDMMTYEQTLGSKPHMGTLTGPEVARYGAEDAFWVLPLFRILVDHMMQNGGEPLLKVFSEQENPMVHVYSKIATTGWKVNTPAISDRRDLERANMASVLRRLKVSIASLLPFTATPHEGLLKYDKWYQNGFEKYRANIASWALSPDESDDFLQCQQVRGPVSNAWAADRQASESTGPNLAHYMPVRTILYDLLQTKVFLSQGKTQSDGEARGKLKDRFEKQPPSQHRDLALDVLTCLSEIAGIEQRMKLYLTPYTLLTDPETKCLYPTVTSMLATRRMGASTPNPMQLAKRGESTYVRGFFEPSYDDHVLVSIDWSAIELVEIAEFSGDRNMCAAFSQIPHDDLHSGAAADILSVDAQGLTETIFKDFKRCATWDEVLDKYKGDVSSFDRLRTNLKGDIIATPADAYKLWRTEIGKGANFNYWYSGWLATVGDRLGWSQDKTKEATERYRGRFPEAEQWRLGVIDEVQRRGFVTLPDGHRYTRYEATEQWLMEWMIKFDFRDRDVNRVFQWLASKIQRRAANQTVNAMIQGSCGTIAKRSTLSVNEWFRNEGMSHRDGHFIVPIHDELVWSVHRDLAPRFITEARKIMISHPDMFQKCRLDASPSVGLTFEPYHAVKAPFGQVELFEMPSEFVGNSRAFTRGTENDFRSIIDRLFYERIGA
jgi:DNA polymerase I-like protein with 3'-5' exonuclease and polymerase domains